MSHYTRTPRMVTPRLVPQSTPVVYTSLPAPYYNEPATRGRRQSMGSYLPSTQQMYHVAASDPSHSRHHRSSSKSHKHRRSHSTDRHGSGRHHRHHRRSATPSHSARYSPEVQYAVSRSPFDRITRECKSNSDFSDYSLQSPPSSFSLGARPPLPQLQPWAPRSSQPP